MDVPEEMEKVCSVTLSETMLTLSETMFQNFEKGPTDS